MPCLLQHRKHHSHAPPLPGRKHVPFQLPALRIQLECESRAGWLLAQRDHQPKGAQTDYTHLSQFSEVGFPHSWLQLNRQISCWCLGRNRLQVICFGLANSPAQLFHVFGSVGLRETVKWKYILEWTAAALVFPRGRSDFAENHHPFNEG